MKKSFIIDLLPEMGVYATTMFGEISNTCVPSMATKFSSRKEATDYMNEHFKGFHAKVRTYAQLDACK